MTQLPDANAVALFLQEYPDFFEHNPDLIAGLRLTTALGGRTVSLQERQVEVLRDKIRQLELKLASLTRNAGSNDVIMSNFHEWILRLLSQDTGADIAVPLLQSLKECFDVPEATLRLWDVKSDYADEWFNLDDIDVRLFADKQPTPVCGPAAGQPGILWLDDATSMQSVALVPLRKPGRQHSFGLMVLGSPDPQRFAAELATDFLARIGETASARLQQLLA